MAFFFSYQILNIFEWMREKSKYLKGLDPKLKRKIAVYHFCKFILNFKKIVDFRYSRFGVPSPESLIRLGIYCRFLAFAIAISNV